MVVSTAWKAVFLLSLLALLPAASAYQLSQLTISSNNADVTAISPGHAQVVDLSFTSDVSQGRAFLDLSQLHDDPTVAATYVDRAVELSQCNYNATNNLTRCTIPHLLIKPSTEEVSIPYRIVYGGSEFPGVLTQTFTLDETAPTVTSIVTPLCNEVTCYIANNVPTNITITLDDSDGTFEKHLIFFKLGNRIFNAEHCDGSTCTAKATVACSDFAPLDLAVVSANGVPSQDDAGNPVTNPGEVHRVRCDAKAPVLVNLSLKGNAFLDLITDGGQLLIDANVQEAVTKVTMTAWLEDIQRNATSNTSESVECEKTENEFQECKLSIDNLVAGKNKRLVLTLEDEVGNAVNTTVTIPSILHSANASKKPDFFTATATSVMPETINRAALQLAVDNAIDYPHFINYAITRHDSSARILYQEVKASTCEMVVEPKEHYSDPYMAHDEENWTTAADLYIANAEGDLRLFDPNGEWNEPNRVDASFLKQDTSKLPSDQVLVRCNLSLYIEKENTYYEVPEQETLYWPITLRESKLGSPGEKFLEKINQGKKDITSGPNAIIGTANELMSTFAHFCQLQDVLNTLASTGLGVEGIGLALMQMGVGQAIMQSGKGITGAALRVTYSKWSSPKSLMLLGLGGIDKTTAKGRAAISKNENKIRKFCDWIHCDTGQRMSEKKVDENGKPTGELKYGNWLTQAGQGEDGIVNDIANKGSKLGATGTEITKNLNVPDVSNSLIMSIATGCWSGVVYNLNKWRQIDCGYVQCLKEQALGGMSITPCEAAKGVKMCRQVLGEVFELPYVRVFKNLLANINKVIQSPLLILRDRMNLKVCNNEAIYHDVNWKGFGCRMMNAFGVIKDFQYVTTYNTMFSFDYGADICQRVLCEGDECDMTTNSYLEQLMPGMGYVGDQYRAKRMRERQTEASRALDTVFLEKMNKKKSDFRAYEKGGDLVTAFNEYAERHGIEEKDREAYWETITDENHLVNNNENSISKGAASRNTLARIAKKGGDVPQKAESLKEQALGNPEHPPLSGGSLAQQQSNAETLSKYNEYASKGLFKCKNGICTPKENAGLCDTKKEGYNREDCTKQIEDMNDISKNLERLGRVPCSIKNNIGLCDCAKRDEKTGKCTNVNTESFINNKQVGDLAKENEQNSRDRQLTENFYSWIDGLGSVLASWAHEQGYTDFLFLSGWGDWGQHLAEQSDKLLNYERWIDDACNPVGSLGDLTEDDGSVYAWQEDSYRAVLTFAGEKLRIGERANGSAASYLYTISGVVVSPFDSNTMRVTLEPGGEAVKIKGGKTMELAESSVTSDFAESLSSATEYQQVCISFEKPFPQPGGDTRYCRDLRANAYDRGGVTNETLPEGGDPYETAWKSAVSSTEAAGNTGGVI